ncbi:hypothetical protein H4R33_002106 [Dimargaris cristalligena]|nr:hypothetical protein H4R33_002106 [Dimargaris cristalligena]
MHLKDLLCPLVASKLTAFNSGGYDNVPPEELINGWFTQIPLESTYAVVEMMADMYHGSVNIYYETSFLSSWSKTYDSIHALVRGNRENPLFVDTNWKYVELASIPAMDFMRQFPIAQVATYEVLERLIKLQKTPSHTEPPPGSLINYDLLHLGINLGELQDFKFTLGALQWIGVQIILNVAIWHLYHTGNKAVLQQFVNMPQFLATPNQDYQQFALLRRSLNFLLTLATVKQDIELIQAITQRWLWTAAIQSGEGEIRPTYNQEMVIDCLYANGLDKSADYLRNLWNANHQTEQMDATFCAKVNFGSRWLRVTPHGSVLLGHFVPHFSFNGSVVSGIPENEKVLPAWNMVQKGR